MLKLILALTFISLSLIASDLHDEATLSRPFITDACTGWANGTSKYDWSHCCEKHDLRFWAGGTKHQRTAADNELMSCIEEASNKFHAKIMRAGVFVGSLSPIKIESKKWGNAWGEQAGYFELNTRHIDELEDSLLNNQTHYNKEEVKNFIKALREASSLDKNNQ